KAYQQKQEPRRGPGFVRAEGAGAAVAAAAPIAATATTGAARPDAGDPTGTSIAGDLAAASARPAPAPAQTLWAEASDLLDGLDAPVADPVELRLALTADEHARLRDRAAAQGVSLEEALRRLI
ncbi:MAG TPA: ribonuclease HI, partial [Microbacterium sp.]|nr:ribonuclease HI [Microbacterium sp.]